MTALRDIDEVAAARFRDLLTAYVTVEQALPLVNKAISGGKGYVSKAVRDALRRAEADLNDYRAELHRLTFDTEQALQERIDRGSTGKTK